MPLPKSSPVSARATDVYSEVCPLVVKLVRHSERHHDDMPSLLAYLRQLLTCCACAGLLEDAMISLSCGHCYCYKCQYNQPILKILCRQCKDRVGLEEESKLRIVVQLYIELMNLLHEVYRPSGSGFDPVSEMIKERVEGVKVPRSVLLIKPPDRYLNVKQVTPKKDTPTQKAAVTAGEKRPSNVATPIDTPQRKKPGRKPKKRPVIEETTEDECTTSECIDTTSECDDANDPDYDVEGERSDHNEEATIHAQCSISLPDAHHLSDTPVLTRSRKAPSVRTKKATPTRSAKKVAAISDGDKIVSLPVSLPHIKPRKPGRPPLKSQKPNSMVSRKIQLSRKIAQKNLLPRRRPGRPLSRPIQLSQQMEVEPVALPHPQPIMPQPVLPHPQPILPHPQPIMPHPQPVLPHSQPVAPKPIVVAHPQTNTVPRPQPILVPHPQPAMCVGSPLICEEPHASEQQVIIRELNDARVPDDTSTSSDTLSSCTAAGICSPTNPLPPTPIEAIPKKRGKKKKIAICRLSAEELKTLKMKPKFKCRCGTNPGVQFGHLICAKRKCPCYLNDIPCVSCRCRGCCNPYN